jgi:hypothetical protein
MPRHHDGGWLREIALLLVIYCVAHLPLLITTGQFYDDFVLNHGDAQTNMRLLVSEGRPLYGYVDNLLLAAHSPFLIRTLTFLAYLASGLLLRGILGTLGVVEPEARFFIVGFTMVFPADSTRVLLILAYYALSYLLFFVAFYLLCLYLQCRKLWLRAVSLGLFFLSFGHMSLLVFFLLVVMYLGYYERSRLDSLAGLRSVMLHYADFLMLPLIFWTISCLAFPPQGSHKDYFSIQLTNFSPICWAVAVRGALVRPMAFSVYPMHLLFAAVIAASTFVLYRLLAKQLPEPVDDVRTTALLLGVGVAAVLAALFPYIAIRKLPEYWDWSGRHAMLVPLGAGFILYYSVRLCGLLLGLRRQLVLGICALMLCVFVAATARTYLTYWTDWYKCLAVMEQFRSSSTMRGNTSFLFRDEAEDWNAKRRKWRFYEFSALMKFAFGDEERFGALEDSCQEPDCLPRMIDFLITGQDAQTIPKFAKFYSLSDWKPKAPDVLVTIKELQQPPSLGELVHLKFAEFFDPKWFQAEVANFMGLEFSYLRPQQEGGHSSHAPGRGGLNTSP